MIFLFQKKPIVTPNLDTMTLPKEVVLKSKERQKKNMKLNLGINQDMKIPLVLLTNYGFLYLDTQRLFN